METSIRVEQLCKSYQGTTVVKNISFQVNKGEIFAFLGPNGAGKSTTISILSTLLKKDSGTVIINGFRLGQEDERIRSGIGIVFQNSVLDELLSVKQNLILRSALYHLPYKQACRRVQKLCDICDLHDIMHQLVGTLSGGQRRRCDIARALIPEPEILILDEPSTGLDPKARKQLWDTISALHKERHMTVFMTTHYMEEAEIADHLCIIKQGNIIFDKPMKEVHKQYAAEQLLLYPASKAQLIAELNRHHIPFHEQNEALCIHTGGMLKTMSVLRLCERYIQRFENHPGNIEELYLQMLQEEQV